MVTIHPFAYKEIDVEKHLEAAGILTMRNYAILEKLLCYIDFNETERIGELDAPIGYTVPWTYQTLAKRTGMSRRSAIYAIKEMEAHGILEREDVIAEGPTGRRKVNRARLKLFDIYLNDLKANPDHPIFNIIAEN